MTATHQPSHANHKGATLRESMTVATRARIRVLVVDDSQFMQRRLTEILESDLGIQVVGRAQNGIEAIQLAERLSPDVITMDINMAKMDGLETIGRLMRHNPHPIVVISSYTRQGGRAAMYALELGVIDIVEKPSNGGVALDIANLAGEIIRKVRTASRVKVVRGVGNGISILSKPAPKSSAIPSSGRISTLALNDNLQVVAIGASTGGPMVLRELVQRIPRDFALPILIVQHMPPRFTKDLASQLSALAPIPVVEAQHGEELQPGRACIAPGGLHLEVDGRNRLQLSDAPPVCYCRPSVDVLFHSLARYYGPRAFGFVLTGMGEDGAAGALALRRAGAAVVAQDEATSVVFGMPKAVIDAGAASAVMSLEEIGQMFQRATTLKKGLS